MALSKEFIESHLLPLQTDFATGASSYLLDVRMCQLRNLTYAFEWNFYNRRKQLLQIANKTDQPFKISKVDASLNELTELELDSIRPFLQLTAIDFSLNKINRVCSLELFKSLLTINLSNNKLMDISFLSTARTVVHVNLSMNEISSIIGLPPLVSLNTLHLNDNQLRSLDGIQSLPYLKELHIQRNYIESLLPLAANRQLICINAAHNRIDSLRNTVTTLQYLNQLKSLILLGNPIERDGDYQSELMRIASLSSLDNITLRQSTSQVVYQRETDSLASLKEAARQAFWNQLTLRRNQVEENVRFLQQRILQQQEEFREYELKLKTDLEATMLHLDGLTMDSPLTMTQPIFLKPDSTGQKPEDHVSAPESRPLSIASEPKPPRLKGDYRGVKDTDEILRLASTELFQEQKLNRNA